MVISSMLDNITKFLGVILKIPFLFRGWTRGWETMAACSWAGLGCSRAETVKMPYLDKDGVKQGHEQGDSGDGSVLLGWPGNPEVVKDDQRTYPSTYLGCSRAVTVTLLTPGYQFWASPLKTSSSDQAASPGCALLYTPH